MGCGSSSQVIPAQDVTSNGHKMTNGNGVTSGHKKDDDHDDLPTVMLPETPVKPKKAPIAFEIPLEELDKTRKVPSSPPPHLQRLLQPPQAEITLPHIEEKLAEAEQRRQMILQQRAASAQKRAQKMMKTFHEMDKLDSEHEPMEGDRSGELTKHATNGVKMPPLPGLGDDKHI